MSEGKATWVVTGWQTVGFRDDRPDERRRVRLTLRATSEADAIRKAQAVAARKIENPRATRVK
jgi:hypothetical protein